MGRILKTPLNDINYSVNLLLMNKLFIKNDYFFHELAPGEIIKLIMILIHQG